MDPYDYNFNTLCISLSQTVLLYEQYLTSDLLNVRKNDINNNRQKKRKKQNK
jgi:hypothetical protein